MRKRISVRKVTPLSGYRIRLIFSDGKTRTADLSKLMDGQVFRPLRNQKKFRQVRVNPEFGCVEWPNGVDLCPDALYYGGPPPWAKK